MSLPISVPTADPGSIAKAITGRDYLSYSQVKMFQSCPLKWHFTYVQQAEPEFIPASLLFGSAVHAAIQHYFQSMMSAELSPDIGALMATYREAWQSEADGVPIQYGRDDTEESLAETAQMILERFLITAVAMPRRKIIGIEESLRVCLSDDLPDLLTRIDLIECDRERLIVTDFKTARSMWSPKTANENAEQLLLYGRAAEAIAHEIGANVQLQFVVLTKAKTPKIESFPIEYTALRTERSVQIIRQVFLAMKAGNVYPAPSPTQCPSCPYQHECRRFASPRPSDQRC
jgi:putative RecB family exonuclease